MRTRTRPSGRRLVAALTQTALAVGVAIGGYAGAAVAAAVPAHALVTPTAVTEFQPNLNATNPGAPPQHGKWGGRTMAIDVDPTTTSTAVAGTESGGLFKTTDGGATWTHLDGLKPFQISDLRFAPNDHNTIVVTTWATSDTQNPGGVWRSTDGGATWSRPTLPPGYCGNNFFAWGMDFQSGSDTAYAGTDCGLLVSSDRGATWTSVAQARVHAVAAGPGVVDVCAGDGHRRYTNSGGVLTQVGGTSLINGGGCPFLNNYHATAHNLTSAPNESNVLLTMSGVQSTTLCGGSAAQPAGLWGLFESDDSGVTWTQIGSSCASRDPWVRAGVARDGQANHFDVYYSGGLDVTRVTCTTGGTGNRCAGLNAAPNVNNSHADFQHVVFRTDGSGCPEFLASDGGVQVSTRTDCGANFTMAAGSGTANGGFNALQVYDVNGQVLDNHTDLYFGTQDNDSWASSDNGATWPRAACCEGFFFQTPLRTSTDTGQILSFVTCAGCGNLKATAAFGNCNYNPSCPGWPNPTGGSPGPDSGAPRLIGDQTYVQWTQPTAGTNQLNLTTNARSSSVTWSTVTNASTAQTLMSHPFVSGPASAPTIYQPVCVNSCGFIAPSGTVLKITGALTGSATVTTVGSGIGSLGTYGDGIGAWLIQEPALGVDPNNPNHLIAADVSTGQMKVSTDGGSTWTVDQALTNLVTGSGRYGFTIPVFGSQVHAIRFDPNNGNHILVGTHEAGIFSTVDGGKTWTTVLGSQQIPNVTGFFFDNVQNDIIVSSYGRGLWKLDPTIRAATLVYDGRTSGDFNDPVTVSATLFDSAGGTSAPIAGATVTLTLGSQSCQATTNAAGHAVCTIVLSNQPPGATSVVASFAGNAQWSAVTTAPTPFTVNRDPTRTALASSVDPSGFGQAVTFTATVVDDSPGGGSPTGTVTFTADGSQFGAPAAVSGNHATSIPLSSLGPGSHTIGAAYSGDVDFLPSAGSLTQVVTCTVNITGEFSGGLTVTSSACIVNAQFNGNITVQPGGSVAFINSTLNGVFNSNGATGLRFCGSTLHGPLTFTNSSGLVLLGDAGDDGTPGCAANLSDGGAVIVTNNHGGAEIGGNTIFGNITLSGTTGSSGFGEGGSPEIEANTIQGTLTCSGNSPAPIDDGKPNFVSGARSGQCAAASF